jgi:hypothetical protein
LRTAVAILVRMPEIGRITREQAAALAGLAPYDEALAATASGGQPAMDRSSRQSRQQQRQQGVDSPMILMRLMLDANSRLVARADVATPLSPSAHLATPSRLLPPRSGLERGDFVPWPGPEVERPNLL